MIIIKITGKGIPDRYLYIKQMATKTKVVMKKNEPKHSKMHEKKETKGMKLKEKKMYKKS